MIQFKMRSLFLILFCLSVFVDAKSQVAKPINVGEKVPNVFLSQLVNYKTKSAHLDDFKEKAIIIDIWATWCSSCIEAMPLLDSIQRENSSDLQVLLVTPQDIALVLPFFKKKQFQYLSLPSVVNDTNNITKLFPFFGLPHQIWIDRNGVVKTITDGRSTTRENVRMLIEGKELNIMQKSSINDPAITMPNTPLILYKFDENKGKMLSYSYLSGYQSQLTSLQRIEVDSSIKSCRLFVPNTSLANLYSISYFRTFGALESGLNHKTILIRKDSKPILSVPDFKTQKDLFCYDAITGDTSVNNPFEYMKEQLDRNFGLRSHLEYLKVKCLILKEIGTSKMFIEKKIIDPEVIHEDKTIIVKNVPLKFWIGSQNGKTENAFPIVNETSAQGFTRVSFSVFWDPNNLEKMNVSLKKVGLQFYIEDRELPVIVLENR